MKRAFALLNIRGMMRPDELKPTIMLILSTLLLTVHRYFGSMEFAGETIRWTTPPLYMFGTAFVLLGLVPAGVVHWVFREPLMSYGLRIGNWKEGLGITAAVFPIIALALLLPASFTDEMRGFYPLHKTIGDSWYGFARFEILRLLLFYTAWEFFFRGFLLFGLRRHVGDWLAICIQMIPSCLWHIGMPTGEIISSIAGGILFGIMAVRTGSILWPLVLHCLIGAGLDFFIVISS